MYSDIDIESNGFYISTCPKYNQRSDGRKVKRYLNLTLNTLEHLTPCGLLEVERFQNRIQPERIASEKTVLLIKSKCIRLSC
jgi:hypothetical protein